MCIRDSSVAAVVSAGVSSAGASVAAAVSPSTGFSSDVSAVAATSPSAANTAAGAPVSYTHLNHTQGIFFCPFPELPDIQYPTSVSYTHLDVYKRQLNASSFIAAISRS